MTHLRTTVWGPAEFVGTPPWWLVGEGILAGTLGTGAIVGAAVLGAWTGRPSFADGEAGLACAVALALYLSLVGAGRALVGIAAVLGVFLALQAPQAAAGMVLAERGQVQSVVVTSVEDARVTGSARARYLCSVTDSGGALLKVRIWRGCGQTTQPGDALAVVYDPKGRVPPRGAETDTGIPGLLRDLAPWAAALVTGSTVAVVRSYRLAGPSPAPGSSGTAGAARAAARAE
ncbi:hypothetical protein LK07_16220 [Streptomyces pluripotens]|uniref:DUF3592 domain-containing protein n=1 Tax=Streptomyces pluripotens TaxID=1355015 RepID=A0A221P8D7_9ACTN|nr:MULTISPECIES: hypothetical protein [Streptomyces]ARP74196.1 hypothetical protein LK06_015085 [Streptomyces pluripotens]ASN28467.1 hypothetical protein LK07_16220 [Streptomyces pluripotens]MCH0557164.1 hypothetical protein [Streptomyces sp. MUM 16J]